MKILNWGSDGFLVHKRIEAYPEGLEVLLKSLFRGRHVEASSESGAGPRSFEESPKECVRPGEMSDKLLRWSLEKVFASRPTPRRKNRAMVIKKSRQDHCLRRCRTGTCVVSAGSVSSSRSGILRGSVIGSLQCLRVRSKIFGCD